VIERSRHFRHLRRLLRQFPIVAILGARQVGKTTLARLLLDERSGPVDLFDLEDPADLARLEDPRLALSRLKGLVAIDEVQRQPELFSVLRVLADRKPIRCRFLVLGSASPALLRQSSESLAGRIGFYTLNGFHLDEVGIDRMDALWLRGGFPRSFLARSNTDSLTWRRNFIRTFLERDLPQLGIRLPGPVLSRFWSMLAHYHGQTWNSSEFARSFGVSDKTVRHYLDILSEALVVTQLRPWHANLRKRQVRSPKIYVRDSGLLHSLLGIDDRRGLERHPKLGASWEGFVIHQLMEWCGQDDGEWHFWATHSGAELDLLWLRGNRRWGFEVKRTAAPSLSRSLMSAINDLELERAFVVHAGDKTFPLHERVTAISAHHILEDLPP
jgi:predicted AAA+ superfamily ATPase